MEWAIVTVTALLALLVAKVLGVLDQKPTWRAAGFMVMIGSASGLLVAAAGWALSVF